MITDSQGRLLGWVPRLNCHRIQRTLQVQAAAGAKTLGHTVLIVLEDFWEKSWGG